MSVPGHEKQRDPGVVKVSIGWAQQPSAGTKEKRPDASQATSTRQKGVGVQSAGRVPQQERSTTSQALAQRPGTMVASLHICPVFACVPED